MTASGPSLLDQWFILLICILLAAYGMHGLVHGVFYMPVRRGDMPTLEGAYVAIPMLACWSVAARLAVREQILLPRLSKRRTAIEISLLIFGVGLWLISYGLSNHARLAP